MSVVASMLIVMVMSMKAVFVLPSTVNPCHIPSGRVSDGVHPIVYARNQVSSVTYLSIATVILPRCCYGACLTLQGSRFDFLIHRILVLFPR